MEQGVKDALEGGITTICAAPGSANVIGGTACVFKPFGKVIDKMVIKDPVALKAATGENPKGSTGHEEVSSNQNGHSITDEAGAT